MKVRGVELNVSVTGSGCPFLWSHGLTSCMSLEDETKLIDASTISEASTLVRWDNRGHGISSFTTDPNDFRWENMAHDMLDIARQLNFPKFVLGGQSMGCAMALQAAVTKPEAVAGLVLMIPPEDVDTAEQKQTWFSEMVELTEGGGPEALIEAWKNPSTFWGHHSTPAVLRHLSSFSPVALPLVFRGGGPSQLPTWQQLSHLRVPTLILAWDGDEGHPISTAHTLKRLMPHATLDIACSVDEVFAWSPKIRDFLKQI